MLAAVIFNVIAVVNGDTLRALWILSVAAEP